jgi:SagB-type dehydrogenase family enzyme
MTEMLVRAESTMTMAEYWHATLNLNIELYREDWAGETVMPVEPLKFKPYRGLPRFPLGDRIRQEVGDVRGSFAEFRATHGDPAPAAPLDREELSRLLYFTFGVCRLDVGPAVVWPYHRLVPSPRAFFPIELYCWIPATGELPAGLYYYDPAHHALVLLRQGEYVELIGAATGAHLSGARMVLLMSSMFWKNSFLYRNYTYRVTAQEAGILAGNALMVAGPFGLDGHVHHQFLDGVLNRLLGLEEPDETVMAVVPLYPTGSRTGVRRRVANTTEAELTAGLTEIRPAYVSRSSLDRVNCAKLLAVHAGTVLTDTRDLVAQAPVAGEPGADEEVAGPPDTRPPGLELAAVLRSRTSGMWVWNSIPRPVPLDDVWSTLRYALDPHASDVAPAGGGPLVECFVLANKVDGLAPGLYRLRHDPLALQPRVLGPAATWLQDLHLIRPPQVNYRATNFVVFLAVNRAAAERRHGDRAFRILGQEAGIVAQRICTMSASVGLTGRVHNGYKASRILELLRLDQDGYAPLFQIILGTARPNARYQMPIVV